MPGLLDEIEPLKQVAVAELKAVTDIAGFNEIVNVAKAALKNKPAANLAKA